LETGLYIYVTAICGDWMREVVDAQTSSVRSLWFGKNKKPTRKDGVWGTPTMGKSLRPEGLSYSSDACESGGEPACCGQAAALQRDKNVCPTSRKLR